MSWRVADWPLRAKFTALTMFISLLSLTLFSGVYALNEYYTARTDVRRELMTLNDAAAPAALGALAFHDAEQAERAIRVLRANPAVMAVRLYKADGNVAAKWSRENAMEHDWPAVGTADSELYGWKMLHLTRIIRLPDGTRIGSLCLCSDLLPVKERMRQTLGALLGLWLISLGVAYLATRYLQELVIRPVLDLSDAMHQVTESKNYARRVPMTSGDEIGRLETSFNELLGKVEASQSELEQRVRERTAELGEMNERLIGEVQKRFRTEAALRSSEERLALAMKGSDLGLWDWNVVTGHVIFSGRLVEMIGYTLEEVAPHVSTWANWVHPEDLPNVMAALKRHLAGETKIYETEHRLKMKDGGWLWILHRGQVVERDTKGKPLRAAGTHLDISPRKEAERLLRESHDLLEQRVNARTGELATSDERFRQLAENIAEVFWMTEPDKNQMLYISPGYEQIWGRACKELYANPRSWLDAIHVDDLDRVLQAFPKQAAGTYDEEYRITRPDGATRWIRDRAFPVRDASGKVVRVAGIATDITEEKLAALGVARQSHALQQLARDPVLHEGDFDAALRAILSSSVAAVEVARVSYWAYTKNGAALRCEQLWNGAGLQPVFTGVELRVADYPRYFATLKNERVVAVNDAVANPRTSEFAELYLKPHGITSMLDAPVRANGRVVGVVCHEHTGTRRVWTSEERQFAASVGDLVAIALGAQKRQQDEEQILLLAHTLESTREMIAIADADNRFIYINEAFQRGYGYSLSELIGKPASVISLNTPESQMQEIPQKTVAGGWQGELMNRAKDGREFPVSLSTSPVFDAAGKLIAMVGVATDISERKRLERETLEAGERERERIGQDLHDDLCQHLTGIRFKAALLEKKLGAGENKMQSDAGEIVRLLADATELARALARGLQPVDPAPGGLMAALQQLAVNTTQIFKLSCDSRFPKPVLMHDLHVATHLYRIAQEAVQNAVKHAAPGWIEIVLETHGDRMILSVIDDGSGIQPSKNGELGLRTMRHRAQLIDAVLEVKPLPERGTVVTCSVNYHSSPRNKKET